MPTPARQDGCNDFHDRGGAVLPNASGARSTGLAPMVGGLARGGGARVGFQASHSGAHAAPTQFALNGSACV